MFTTTVWCQTQFEGYHYWEGATGDVSFLKHPHRHMFHVRLEVYVSHEDRDVEFITLKKQLAGYIDENWVTSPAFQASCEMIAEDICSHFSNKLGYAVHSCTVSEDGENGGTVRCQRPALISTASTVSIDPLPQKVENEGDYIWVGIEAEGPYRNKETIFIPGRASPDDVKKAVKTVLRAMPDTQFNLYYGAKNDRGLRLDTIGMLRELIVTEGRLDDLLIETTNVQTCKLARGLTACRGFEPEWIVTICFMPDYRKSVVGNPDVSFFKMIMGTTIKWVAMRNDHNEQWIVGDCFNTDLHDSLFSEDKIVCPINHA